MQHLPENPLRAMNDGPHFASYGRETTLFQVLRYGITGQPSLFISSRKPVARRGAFGQRTKPLWGSVPLTYFYYRIY